MTQRAIRRVCIAGGVDFTGGHFAHRLLAGGTTEKLMVFYNFSPGRQQHLATHEVDPWLTVVKGACGTAGPPPRPGTTWWSTSRRILTSPAL